MKRMLEFLGSSLSFLGKHVFLWFTNLYTCYLGNDAGHTLDSHQLNGARLSWAQIYPFSR